jgi:asparagine synthase (glutamine-hydrolysing)
MCGIVGKIDFGGPVSASVIHSMCGVIEHRGPDARGVYLDDGVGLGIQRLAIIDVEHGDQPIFNEDRTVAVVLNGEIYNYLDLREQLLVRGHRFRTHADTEVLVHLYEEYGVRMVEHLRGMFAFAIWDDRKRQLFVARDRVGKKPLFWARRGNCVWFASEVRALLADPALPREVNHDAIASYLALQYVPHPQSAFAGIEKLPPASTLVVTEDAAAVSSYWALDYGNKLTVPEEEVRERLWEHIREATRIRLMSEVPLGAFLSGGIDSSAVVAAMAHEMAEPVKTFSIGFSDAAFDELEYARLVAQQFGTDHHEYVVEPHALEVIPKLVRHYGEPFADSSAIPSFYLAELTSRHVTVALNGDGGDESFAGYNRYVSNDLTRHLSWVPRPVGRLAPPIARLIGEGSRNNSTRTRIQRLARSLAMDPAERYAMWMSAFDGVRRNQVLTPEFAASVAGSDPSSFITDVWRTSSARNRVDSMLDTDVQTYLPGDLLVKMDIATMAYSVEARSPFLDHRLMEFAASLPAHLKLKGMTGKRVLKDALRGRIPDAILDRPKMGFGVPLVRWFRDELRELPREVLLDPAAVRRGYFRRDVVERLIREHQASAADHSARLWVLLQLEFWHREVVESPRATTYEAVPAA